MAARIDLLGGLVNPLAAYQEPYTIRATNDVWQHLVWVFPDTATRDGIAGSVAIPSNYTGGATLKIVWTSTVTTGNVVWDFDYRSVGGDNTSSLDQATVQESVTVTDAAPTAANNRLEASVALTASNLAAHDTLQFTLYRDGADAGDTMAAAALLVGAYIEYS